MKYPKSPVLLLAFVLALFASTNVYSQSSSGASLSTALNADGSVKRNIAGSFDPSGFRMSYGPNGEPRFVNESQLVGGCTPDSWDTSFTPNGANDDVNVIVSDGAGNLYFGGSFTSIQGVPASGIAKWNGTTWSALGTGVSGTVKGIGILGSDIYVGGGFGSAGGVLAKNVAKWNGSSWSALGAGLGGGTHQVEAVQVYGNDVLIGGSFNIADGSPANGFVRWDGTSYSTLGAGLSGQIYTMAVSGGNLYVGGFMGIAGDLTNGGLLKWDGTSWSGMGLTASNTTVLAIGFRGSEIFVGGTIRGPANLSAHVAKFDGTAWSSIGNFSNSPEIYAFAFLGSDVYAAGTFVRSGGIGNGILKYDGSQWTALGSGTELGNHTVRALYTSGNTLYLGGDFQLAGGVAARNIASLTNGTTWGTPFPGTGLDNSVSSIAVSGSDVYLGGSFIGAGPVTANRIVKWNSTTNSWSTLAGGVSNGSDTSTVSALAVAGGKVYAGGSFSQIGGVSASNIAVWNGTTWAPLGTGVNGRVWVIGVKGEDVYAAGDFLTAGGVTANRIAKWNGTAWSGLNSSSIPNVIVSMAFMGNDIYVATPTTTVANPAYFSKYDGTSWTALGGDLGDRGVSSVAVIGNDVYVAGGFTMAGAITVNRVAKWNGSTWSALGGGLPQPTSQFTGVRLAVSGTDLIAIGDFTVATGGPADRIAKWNGTSWSPLGHGVNTAPTTVTAAGGDIFVGGNFTIAGCNQSPYFARWRDTVWTGSTNTDWHTVTNWGSGSVPPANGSVTIASSDASISSADVTMNSLIVTNGRTLTIGAGRTLTVTGTLDLTNGSLAGPGNLIVNDLSLNGGAISGVGSTTVNGNLFLGSGTITGGPVTITSCRAGALAGGTASTFIAAALTRCVNSSGTYRFPVGTGSVYAPIELANVSGSGNFTVDPKAGAHPGATGLPINRLQRWWDMTNSGITRADVTFTYADSEVVGRENWYRIYGINGASATQFPSVINTTTNRMTVTGVTTFGAWTLGEGTPAPRTLTGRLTNPSGRGAFNILVSLTDDQGNIRYTMVNPSGYYRFLDVPTFKVYTVKVSSKKFTFPTPQRTVEFDEFTSTINFVSSDN